MIGERRLIRVVFEGHIYYLSVELKPTADGGEIKWFAPLPQIDNPNEVMFGSLGWLRRTIQSSLDKDEHKKIYGPILKWLVANQKPKPVRKLVPVKNERERTVA